MLEMDTITEVGTIGGEEEITIITAILDLADIHYIITITTPIHTIITILIHTITTILIPIIIQHPASISTWAFKQ